MFPTICSSPPPQALFIGPTNPHIPITSVSTPYIDQNPHLYVLDITDAGLGVPPPPQSPNLVEQWVRASAEAITEIRRISGLTWDQIGEIFGVDRRTVHFWASGRPLRKTNHERLLRVYEVIRRADTGDPALTRALLLDTSQGRMLKDLLADQEWGQTDHRVAGREPLPGIQGPPPLSMVERKARRSTKFVDTLESSDEPIHPINKPILRSPSRNRPGGVQ